MLHHWMPMTHTWERWPSCQTDQSSQALVTESSVQQEDGPSAMGEVSSAYWSRLVFPGEEARE